MFRGGRQVFQVGQAPSGPAVIRPLLVTLGEGCHASHQPSDASTPSGKNRPVERKPKIGVGVVAEVVVVVLAVAVAIAVVLDTDTVYKCLGTWHQHVVNVFSVGVGIHLKRGGIRGKLVFSLCLTTLSAHISYIVPCIT